MKTTELVVSVSMTRSYNYQSSTYSITEKIELDEDDDRAQAMRESRERLFIETSTQTSKAHKKFVEAAKP